MITDGITINGKHSYKDFNLFISERLINAPPKKAVLVEIPHMNGFYDFTELSGSWGARELKYTFDIVGSTIKEMDEIRTSVLNWLCNVKNAVIKDDSIPDYHFLGSYDSCSETEDGEKTELTVTFICQPFKYSNEAISKEITVDGEQTIENIGQPTTLEVTTTGKVYVTNKNMMRTLNGGSKQVYQIENGENKFVFNFDNELKYPYQEGTHTESGITYTVSSDGAVNINGTATDISWFYIRAAANAFVPSVGRHTISGVPQNLNGKVRTQVYEYDGTKGTYYYDEGFGGFLNVTEKTQYLSVAIRVEKGAKINNVSFVPQIHGTATCNYFMAVI